MTAAHAEWANDIAARYDITEDNAWTIVQEETGLDNCKVLEQAGVYREMKREKKLSAICSSGITWIVVLRKLVYAEEIKGIFP